MGLFALAVAPGIAICLYIYFKDKYNREPRRLLIWSFILGVLCVIPPAIIQVSVEKSGLIGNSGSIAGTAIFAYLVVAVSEEFSKFLVLRFYCYPKKAFDDPFDGIIYAVMVGMGFATIENVGYVYDNGIVVGLMRLFLSVPAHATFAILMGYFVGLAKFNSAKSGWYLFLGLFLAIFFHGTYDFCLFAGKTWMNFAGALVSLIIAMRLSFKAIRKKQELSRIYFESSNLT